MQLNHICNRITSDSQSFLINLFTCQLDCFVLRQTDTDVWLRQRGTAVDLQFCETSIDPNIIVDDKHNSHISFLTETPEQDLRRLGMWIEAQGYRVAYGSWSNQEYWLDVPEVFVDFVIEAMVPGLAEYDR